MSKKLKPRWGHLTELDKRVRVGTTTYNKLPTRLKHLTAWRAMHKLAGSHMPVRMSGTRAGIRPSSNLSLQKKEAFVLNRK